MSARPPHVTITLGRRGQVVKRERGCELDDSCPESLLTLGSKRSVRERLGSNTDDSHSYSNMSKRQRTGGNASSYENGSLENGTRLTSKRPIGHDDLRLKLIKKKGLNGQSQSGVDLREKLSRNKHSHGNRSKSQPSQSQTQRDNHVRPSRRITDDGLPSSCLSSSWAYSTLREGGRTDLRPSNHRSPPCSIAGPASRPDPPSSVYRTHCAPSSGFARGLDPTDASRSVPRSEYVGRAVAVPADVAPPPPPLPQEKPEETANPVETLLLSLGLHKYNILLQAEEVDMSALRQMGESDLKELGIPMGPRKKILQAVQPHSKQRYW